MQIAGRKIDDFKIDRKGITPPLPTVLRLVPLLLYCSIAVTISLCSVYFVQFRQSVQKRDQHKANTLKVAAEAQTSRNERTALEVQIKIATDIESWVAGSRPLQPLIIEIARSMGSRSTIVDLHLDRDANAPAQLKLDIKLGTDSTKQLDFTLDKIAAQKYRAFSPRQTLGRSELDYSATLVWQNPSVRALQTPPPSAPNE